ncbi:hypothetical protein WOLCODRAFT_142658 [Wolfiporia cocos MD-104 SS10]|uniref:Uncharacterized protein n=1 Tax=Wolfiporia cocos (strain MD-104) TaxID=742152 RepID=A0A2H3J8U1_WOLCO|nr:hypothetical protein WOLCODRAFT_142658 [Wolfiporia cocos MD-104 SS10]
MSFTQPPAALVQEVELMLNEAICYLLSLVAMPFGLPILWGHAILHALFPRTFYRLSYTSLWGLAHIGGTFMLFAFSLAAAIYAAISNAADRVARPHSCRSSTARDSTAHKVALFLCGMVAGALGPIFATAYNHAQGLRYPEAITVSLRSFVERTTMMPEEAVVAAMVGYMVLYSCIMMGRRCCVRVGLWRRQWAERERREHRKRILMEALRDENGEDVRAMFVDKVVGEVRSNVAGQK